MVKMIEIGVLSPPLLENRDYVHGTSILDGIVSLVGPLSELQFRLGKRADSALTVCSISEAEEGTERRKAMSTLKCMRLGQPTLYTLYATPGQTLGRINYDEDACRHGSTLVGDTIVQEHGPPGYSCISRIVALNKALLTERTAKDSWLFVGLELKQYPKQAKSIEISASLSGSHSRLVRSRIILDDAHAGSILFAVRPEKSD